MKEQKLITNGWTVARSLGLFGYAVIADGFTNYNEATKAKREIEHKASHPFWGKPVLYILAPGCALE